MVKILQLQEFYAARGGRETVRKGTSKINYVEGTVNEPVALN